MRIETSVTRLLGIDLPIVQAGMSWASSDSALPLAVSRAGGLGVIAAGPMRLADLEHAIDEVRSTTDRPYAVNLPLYRKGGADEVLDLIERKRVPVLIASQGGPQRYLARLHAIGTVCLHVVASEEHARKAADAGVDGLVVVGGEAGGHPPASLVSTLVIVRAVASAVDTPIIASGGFADGAGLAAALALGAGAAQFGTRFLASVEANVHPAYKEAVLQARVADTRTVGRELGMIRALTNEFTTRMAKLEDDGATHADREAEFTRATLKAAALHGDVEGGKVEAGQTAGLIGATLPAAEIVGQLAREYVDTLGRLPHPS